MDKPFVFRAFIGRKDIGDGPAMLGHGKILPLLDPLKIVAQSVLEFSDSDWHSEPPIVDTIYIKIATMSRVSESAQMPSAWF
jgi:hypothetical protein